MAFRSARRGQAVQVGAVLLLGFLVVALSIYQVTVVPDQNRAVEFEGYMDASTDMRLVHGAALAAGQRGASGTTTVKTGARYPPRTLFVNPPPAVGTLAMTGAGANARVNVTGAVAVESEGPNVGAYWDGSERTFRTRALTFRPDYNQFATAATVRTTGTGTYRIADGGTVALTGQSLLSGDRLTVLTLNGSLAGTGGVQTTVSAEPVSVATETVTVTGESDTDPVTVTVPTPGEAAKWNRSSAAQSLRTNPRVKTVKTAGARLANVTLDGSETYELRLARVFLHKAGSPAGAGVPDPKYVVADGGDNASVSEDAVAPLSVAVRDRFNNPTSGEEVTFTVPSGNGTFVASGADSVTATTNAAGRATALYEPSRVGNETIVAGRDTDGDGSLADEDALNRTQFGVAVQPAPTFAGETSPGIKAGDATGTIILQTGVNATDGSPTVTFEFRNEASKDVNVTGYRFAYATQYDNNEIEDGPNETVEMTVSSTTSGYSETKSISAMEGQEPVFFASNPFTLESQTVSEVDLTFDRAVHLSTRNDAVTVSIKLYLEGGYTAEYAVYVFGQGGGGGGGGGGPGGP